MTSRSDVGDRRANAGQSDNRPPRAVHRRYPGATVGATGTVIGLAVVVLVLVVLGAGVVSHVRGTSGASSRAGRAAIEVESLFSPAKRHQVEQQEIVDTTRVDQGDGDGNPLERYTDAAALRQRWNEDHD